MDVGADKDVCPRLFVKILMQYRKAFLSILIVGLAIGSFLMGSLGFFFLPEYKMNSFAPRENEIVRWSYLMVGILSSIMAASSTVIWLVASIKAKMFSQPTISEIIVIVLIVILWSLLVMDEAWGVFMRLHTVSYF